MQIETALFESMTTVSTQCNTVGGDMSLLKVGL